MTDAFHKAQLRNVVIVELGTRADDKEKRGTCRSCGTKIKFKPADIQRVYDQRDGDYFCIKCPLCDEPITVAA